MLRSVVLKVVFSILFLFFIIASYYIFFQENKLKKSIGARETLQTNVKESDIFISVDGNGTECTKELPCGFDRFDFFSENKLRPNPGDRVFFREGIYYFFMDGVKRVYLPGGTKEKPIVYESYQKEKVIFDGSKLSRKNTENEIWREGRLELRENYIHLRNVEVREMPQYGIKVWGNYNIVEGCKVYNNALSGIQIFNYKDGYSVQPTGGSYNIIRDNIIFKNSDEGLNHHNYNDGGNADGITVHSGVDNLIEYNTVYENSDDGIDVWKSMGSQVFSNLIYKNGEGTNGDGYGVKLGGAPKESPLGANAVAKYNISHTNRKSGFNVNGGKKVLIEFNTAYNNGEYGYTLQDDTKISHNIALENKLGDYGWSKGLEQINNSWQLGQKIEFISFDTRSEDFLRPKDSTKYKYLGAFGIKKDKE